MVCETFKSSNEKLLFISGSPDAIQFLFNKMNSLDCILPQWNSRLVQFGSVRFGSDRLYHCTPSNVHNHQVKIDDYVLEKNVLLHGSMKELHDFIKHDVLIRFCRYTDTHIPPRMPDIFISNKHLHIANTKCIEKHHQNIIIIIITLFLLYHHRRCRRRCRRCHHEQILCVP